MNGCLVTSAHLSRAAIVLSIVAAAVRPAPLEAEIRNRVVLGYDSFIDRFTILEADTFESVHEFSVGLGNGLMYRDGTVKAGVNNFLRFSNQTIDEALDAEASITPTKSAVIDLRGTLHWKHFQEGSDYEFGNDYTQVNAVLKIRHDLGTDCRMSLKSRFELIDYGERTDFDYDYGYADGGVEIEAGPDFSRAVRAGIYAGRRDVPDSTALTYDRATALIEARLLSVQGIAIHFASTGDRRDYRETVRSSTWSVMSFLDLSFNASNGAVYSLRGESELTTFDRPDTIYFDTHFVRGGVRARFPLRSMSSCFIEPRYARMLCHDFGEERYQEISCILGADLMEGDKLWLSLAYEPGYRDYSLEVNDLYSDYHVNRISAMGNLSLPHKTAFNLCVTHEPERHSRREDDFSVTLLSIDFTKRF